MIAKIRGYLTLIQMIISVSIVIVLMYIFNDKNHTIRKQWAKMQLMLLGIDLQIEGEADIDANILMINHQSVLDIIVLEYLYPKNIAWIAKKEIGDIPWFGHILKAPKMIQVQRESKSSLIKLLKDAKIVLDDNRPLAIFPEGTRSNGKKMRKFKSGAKIIAEKYNLKVQPIILIGTLNILDSKSLKQQSGKVIVKYLPSVEAAKGSSWWSDTEQLMNEEFYKGLQEYDI